MKRTLTLRPGPARMVTQKPPPPVVADPVKITLAQALGFRFISRQGRYILQARRAIHYEQQVPDNKWPLPVPIDHTWVDIPLVPEVYG